MGTKPRYLLAGLFVVSSLVCGCRNGPSGSGFDRSPQMVGQAPTGFSSSSMTAGRTATGLPATTQMGTAQPMPNATTFPSATTTSISAASTTPQYMGGNAFTSQSTPASMPTGANYQMQPQNVQMQAPNVQSADDNMPRMPQTLGAGQTPRSFGSAPQQSYRTDPVQSMTPGGDQQQYPGR